MSSDDDKFPATPTAPGWYPLNDGSDQETYWDGSAWTKRRQYRFGSPFIELPLHHGDPPLAPLPPPPNPSAPSSRYLPPPPTASSPSNTSASVYASIDRNWPQTRATQASTPSPNFRRSRQRIRFLQAIYFIAIIGFFVSGRGSPGSANPQKYFAILFFVGIGIHVLTRLSSSGARRDIRAQESGRRPTWPFRYLSRLTDGLVGPRLTSFIGGMRTQPRFAPMGFNATVPMVRLSLFPNGIRLGPSSSLLSMNVPTWEARFDELDAIQAIGRVQGMTTGILFRKAQSHDWIIFWTFNRDRIFATFEQIGINVNRDPIRIRMGSQWRVNQFVEDQVHPTEPSVLGAPRVSTSGAGQVATAAPLVYAAPITSTAPAPTTPAPEDKKWPGIIVLAAMAFFIISVSVLVTDLVRGSGVPVFSNDGGVTTTVTTPGPVVTISPSAWRSSVEKYERYLTAPLTGLPNSISYLHQNFTATEDSIDVVSLTTTLGAMDGIDCPQFHFLAVDSPPSPALAHDAANVNAACDELVATDDSDLHSSQDTWTPKLASDDAHWLAILKERLAVLRAGVAN
ncbi:MAG: hypothetical protein WCF25_01360 [Acidimicrobiales bacterium]